jgi:hypothetical protein
MDAHTALVRTRNLISDESNWCGSGWGYGGQRCVLHALAIAQGDFDATDPTELVGYTDLKRIVGGVGYFNDNCTHAEVLALCDAAIAATAPQPDTSFLNEVETEIAA